MMEKGASSLSNAELIAILLRTGTGKMNAIEVARELLRSADNRLGAIMTMPLEHLCKTDGIGLSKAVGITAAFELGRRCSMESAVERKESITNPMAAFHILEPKFRGLDHEECWGLFLNRANYVIGAEKFSSGGLDSTVIDPKVIVRKALERKATSIILAHNHPSGNPMPGTSDIRETGNLKKALDTCGIALTDHIIIAEGCYYSFADEEKVDFF